MKKNQRSAAMQKFIHDCTITFKLMEHTVFQTQKSKIWHFTSLNRQGDKKYAIYCTPSVNNFRAIIQAAINMARLEQLRLVVIALNYTEEDLIHSETLNYSLIKLDELRHFGDQMLEIKKAKREQLGRVIVIE